MFDGVGHKFYADEHKFEGGEHKFHVVEHKIYRRKKSFVRQTENKSIGGRHLAEIKNPRSMSGDFFIV